MPRWWPFGNKTKVFWNFDPLLNVAKPQQEVTVEIEKSEPDITILKAIINDAVIYRPCESSPNGVYHVATTSLRIPNPLVHAAEVDAVLLVKNSKIVLAIPTNNTTQIAVANDGTVISACETAGTRMENLESNFEAITEAGECVYATRLGALILNLQIAPDGSHAAVQLANSFHEDAGKLFLFDLRKKTQAFSIHPLNGWAKNGYLFDTQQKTTTLLYDNGLQLIYTFSGELINPEDFEQHKLLHGGPWELLEMATKAFKEATLDNKPVSSQKALKLVERAISKITESPNLLAQAHRLAGEVFESEGDKHNAIKHFEKALEINPKCGIKKRLAALKS
jgi:hypothetical protein